MERICAYCNKEGKLTREHIFPSFLYEQQRILVGNKIVGWSEAAQNIIPGEAVIRDVCQTCNNETLGDLDYYAERFLAELGVYTKNFSKKKILMKYNYEKLSRWLLKVSYNSSRASRKQHKLLSDYRGYILGEESVADCLIIKSGLLRPYRLKLSEINKYADSLLPDSNDKCNPFMLKVSCVELCSIGVNIKQIVIGALIFHVILLDGTNYNKNNFHKLYSGIFKGMRTLDKKNTYASINQIKATFIDLAEPNFLRGSVIDALENYIKTYNRF